MTLFPNIEQNYLDDLLAFQSNARRYGEPLIRSHWELLDGVPVRNLYDETVLDKAFFDWCRIGEQVRIAVASYYRRKYPAFPISADPNDLTYFFAGREFDFSVGQDVTATDDSKDIYAISLGAWPDFRNALIEHHPEEAAHLASVVFKGTAGDWRPVGNRDESDPLKFLKGLQAGNAVRENANFSLFRLQL